MLILLHQGQGLLLFLNTGNHICQLYTRSYLSIAIGDCRACQRHTDRHPLHPASLLLTDAAPRVRVCECVIHHQSVPQLWSAESTED